MANKPELSIKVSVDPVINQTKFQEDINKLIPESNPVKINGKFDAAKMLDGISDYQKGGKNAVTIHGKIDAAEALKSIAKYQEGGQNQAVILGKFTNVKEMLNDFKNETAEINASLTQDSLSNIRDQLQGIINGLDVSKVGSASSEPSKKKPVKGNEKQISVDVTPGTTDESIDILRSKIQNGLTEIPITANISPVQLNAIRKSVTDILADITFDPTVKKVNSASQTTTKKKKIDFPSEDRLSEMMANAQYTATKTESAEAASAKQKNIIYQNLVNHQAKAAESANSATAQTAQGLSDANKAMGDLNTKAEEFGQNWRQVVTLIANATKNLANLMKDNYGGSFGLDIFSSFQEFQKELPDLDTDHVKPYLKTIKDWGDLLLESAGGEFNPDIMIQAIHMLSGLADAWNQIDVAKLTNNQTKEKLLQNMSELNSIFPSSGDKEPFLGEKDAAINYLTDLLAKAAKYYAEVGNAAKQTADSIAVANEGFANQTTELKKTNSELERTKQLSFDSPELVVQKEEQKPIELPLPETPNYTKPSETLDDYRDSVGAAANIQQYFASEVDNATASLGSQSETLKALKKSLDEYTGSIDGVEKFAKAEKELDRLKKKLAQQQQQQPAQPAPQPQPNNQPPAPIKPNNNPKPHNNGQPPAPPAPPNNQPPNNGGNNGGSNNLPVENQQKLEQALERIMMKMITAQNKKDTSGDKNYGKNVAEQVKWQGQLHDRAEELIDKLNANYPGWEKSKSWQRHGENIAHARNDYSTAREDKQDLDTVQKLGKELQRNLKLREALHKIDKNIEPVKYQNTQDDIKKSKAEIARLRSEAKAKGLNTNEVTSDFLKSAAELQEKLTNKAAAKAKADADDWLDTAKKNISEAKSAYISAQKEIDELDKQATKTHDRQTQANIASEKKLWETKRDNAEKTINGYLGGNADKYATDANKEIDSVFNRVDIKDSIAAEKENTKLLTDYNNQLQTTLDILKEIQKIDQNQSPVKYADAQRRLAKSKAETARLGNDIKGKRLTTSADFIKANTEYVAGYKNLQEDIKNKEADKALKDQGKTLKENTDLLVKYDQELTKQFNLYKDLKRVDPNNAQDQAAKQLAFNDQKAKVDDLQKQIAQKGLHTDPAYIQRNNQYTMDVAGFDRGQDIKTDKTINAEATKAINTAKNKYLDAYDAIQKKREELSKIDDAATKQMIQNAIAVQRGIMKSAGNEINSYGKNYGNLVSDTWNEISIHRNDSQIKSQSVYETKANKEAAATKKENLNLLKQYNQSLNEELKLLKQVYAAETAEGKAAAQNALNDQRDKTENLRKQLKGKGLDVTSDYQKYNTQNALNEAAINAKYNGTSIEDLKNTYIKNLREREANINAAYSTEDADKIARITQRIEDNNKAIQEAGFALTQFGQKANNAWAEISKINDELDITAEQKFNKALELQTKQTDAQAKKAISNNEKLLNRIERAMRNQEKAYSDYQSSEDNTQDKETKLGRLNIRNEELKGLRQQAGTRGLTVTQEYLTLEKQHREEILGIDEALQKRAQAEQEAIRVQDEDRISLLNYIKTIEKYKDTLEKDGKTDNSMYGKSVDMSNAGWDLLNELNKNPDNKDQVARLWGQKYNIQGVTDLESAFKALAVEAAKAGIEVQDLRTETEKLRSVTQAKTNIANLKSQLMDYLEKFPKVGKALAEPVQKLKAALADPNAYKNAGQLKQALAELRAQAKSLGLESENLIDKFEKLFGQHLSTMITMAALHKMQDALRIVYQNVVEIDTALIELRKVSELSGKALEEYMGRAAEQAQSLGVSISDYIGSTADWKRLGYSDEDAENMATYSTLLKNVGDGIDDVNTSSSYLISTLQGFGLLAKDAESVVDKIDKVANTQPITAQAIGEILTRSAASMKAANNDLAETISLGTAAYAVIQNAETVGTTLKSVSMYLRAAKSELESAGESADGCANSVSELRSELKSLTGVDIMIDNKNFKSTYQILKELSQVWDKLSDVTQANVTEMIGGKRNANAVSAILNNFDVAESSLEAAANSAGTAWEENSVWLDSIQARLSQLDASFQALSQDVLSSDLVKTGISFLTSIVKLLDQIVNLTGALPLGLGISAFVGQLGKPKMTGFMIVPSNTPGGDTEQARCSFYWRSAAREYLVKPTNMVA